MTGLEKVQVSLVFKPIQPYLVRCALADLRESTPQVGAVVAAFIIPR